MKFREILNEKLEIGSGGKQSHFGTDSPAIRRVSSRAHNYIKVKYPDIYKKISSEFNPKTLDIDASSKNIAVRDESGKVLKVISISELNKFEKQKAISKGVSRPKTFSDKWKHNVNKMNDRTNKWGLT